MPNRIPVQRMYTTPNTMVSLDVKGFCVGLVWRFSGGLVRTTRLLLISLSFVLFINHLLIIYSIHGHPWTVTGI